MRDLLFCKQCKHTTMQVLVDDMGDVEITCATCRKKVLGFTSEDDFMDVLHDMQIIHRSVEAEFASLN